jgi:predicted MFS family arabinose efflux permease
VPLKKLLMWSVLLGTALYSTQLILISGLNRELGISDQVFVLGDSVILTVLGQVAFMPILVLAARLCPEGVEATLFATIMSILNAGAALGAAVGALLTEAFGVTSDDFTHLFGLTAVCIAANLLPAPFLNLLPDELSGPEEAGTEKPAAQVQLGEQAASKGED